MLADVETVRFERTASVLRCSRISAASAEPCLVQERIQRVFLYFQVERASRDP
jgi:hypothetical protein